MTERPKSSHVSASAREPIVVIIDDDASMRRALSDLFESVGLLVELFGSASEMLQSKLPDLASCLVLDIRLLGLGGLDFQTERTFSFESSYPHRNRQQSEPCLQRPLPPFSIARVLRNRPSKLRIYDVHSVSPEVTPSPDVQPNCPKMQCFRFCGPSPRTRDKTVVKAHRFPK